MSKEECPKCGAPCEVTRGSDPFTFHYIHSATATMTEDKASLITAAPDLLQAAVLAEQILSNEYGGIEDGYWPTIAPAIYLLRAAIAKAKGQS